jgi:hypothetical protein
MKPKKGAYMNKMKVAFLTAMCALGISTSGFAMSHEVVNTDNFNLNIGGRIQEVAYGQMLHEPVQGKDNARLYLFLKQARLNLNGRVNGIKYSTEWVGAAEDVNGSNNGLTLLDFWFDVPLFNLDSTWFKVGQFKVPYGREAITDEAQMQFVAPSINFIGANLGRDVGAAVHTYIGKFAGTAGVYTGGSRDVPLRFLPERLGVPMLVARLGYNNGLDQDIFTVAQNDLHPQRFAAATYVNGMWMKDTRIGHSTVLNSRTSEKSLLLNTNWNPFLNQGAPVSPATTPNNMDRGHFWQLGWDGALRGPVGSNSAWNAEAEFNYAHYDNRYGKIKLPGARAQVGFVVKKFEAALRYAVLYPDNNFKKSGVSITGSTPIEEIAPAFSYYIHGHDHKVVLDFPILLNVPVFVENGIGSYVSLEQPDQTSVLSPSSKGFMQRQTVIESRLMYQLAF